MTGVICLILLGLPLSVVFYIPLGQLWCEWRNGGEFDLHRDRYESIAKAISARAIPPGKFVHFVISTDKDPATLREVDDKQEPDLFLRENETKLVQARVENGRLTIRICTYSMGHAGVYGLYYSGGAPLKGEVENSFGADGRIASVAPNWWRVSDYSQ